MITLLLSMMLNYQEPIEPTRYMDIPLSHEIQNVLIEECITNEVPVELVVALIDNESSFNPNAISGTGDYGYLQINECNHESLNELFGYTDFLDPVTNIKAGTYLVGQLYKKYNGDLHKTLMAYNMGDSGAKRLWKKGITKSKYSEKVVTKFNAYTRATTNGIR